MLGKQRKNQATDSQFMDAAWKNMAEILDQEMPVEKKERRIGWLSIAAILVMGFVGGITVMWGLQKHQSTPMAINHPMDTDRQTEMTETTTDHKYDKVSYKSQNAENSTLSSDKKTAYNTNNTNNKNTITSNFENKTASVTALNTSKQQVAFGSKNPSSVYFDQNELSRKSDVQNSLTSLAVVENNPEKTIPAARVISIEPIGKVENPSTPLNALPILDMATLPVAHNSLTIDHDLDLPKNKKWRTGVYAGAIIAGKTGNGLETALRVERKIGAKWAVETGLGVRATQLGFLSENKYADDLALSDDYQGLSSNEPAGFSEIERAQIANKINADAPDYHLTVPLSFVYRPVGKLRLALGMSWAYRLNKLKGASSLDILDGSFEADNSLNKNSFSERFSDFRLNLGVGYQFNARTGIELAYSERLNDRNSNNNENSLAGTIPLYYDDGPVRFFQLGLMYYFGG